ncbi:Hypothetical_protein [Hexamita inflata]|uniref:Hypothetical_protein n=1 Tax=Hexamita inflata TaxID=28002 RepID=A0ABP1KKA7_9EUKA
MIGIRTQYVIYNQQRKHWTCRGPRCSSSTGQSERFQVFLNHEKQWRTFSFNLNRELKMKYWTSLNQNYNSGVTVAFILNIQIMNAFLFLEEWNQVGQSAQHQIIY